MSDLPHLIVRLSKRKSLHEKEVSRCTKVSFSISVVFLVIHCYGRGFLAIASLNNRNSAQIDSDGNERQFEAEKCPKES